MDKLKQKKKYYGHVVTFRIYGSGIEAEHKEAFQRMSIDLIDVPLRGKTTIWITNTEKLEQKLNGVNKRMIVDMLSGQRKPSSYDRGNHSKNKYFAVCTESSAEEGYNIMSAYPIEVLGEKIYIWEVN